jgi:Calcineurin-like phosphoesterase
MIDRVLSRGFLSEQLARVGKQLEKKSREEAFEPGLEEARTEVDRLLSTLAHDQAEALDASESKTYVPNEPVLSMLQTIIEERIYTELPQVLEEAEGFTDPAGPIATHIAVEPGPEEALGDFTQLDPGWEIGITEALIERLARGKHEFVSADPPPDIELACNARVILVGDWGTGAVSACNVAEQIRFRIDEVLGDRELHVIHLGDVYYSGEPWEVENRFLHHWPVQPGESDEIRSWSLMGNHDMYSGGEGYFKALLGDKRFWRQRLEDGRGISYFRLANRDWQLLGLDTAWDDHILSHRGHDGFLQDPQADWATGCVRSASDELHTMLLSHHQFLSTHTTVAGNLAEKLEAAFESGPIDAWFWGHEHRCEVFSPSPHLVYGACIGHGAMPEKLGDVNIVPGGEWEYDEGHGDGDGDHWRWCGFAVLDFNGSEIDIQFINEQGVVHNPGGHLPLR